MIAVGAIHTCNSFAPTTWYHDADVWPRGADVVPRCRRMTMPFNGNISQSGDSVMLTQGALPWRFPANSIIHGE
jgi:hypothetical protein